MGYFWKFWSSEALDNRIKFHMESEYSVDDSLKYSIDELLRDNEENSKAISKIARALNSHNEKIDELSSEIAKIDKVPKTPQKTGVDRSDIEKIVNDRINDARVDIKDEILRNVLARIPEGIDENTVRTIVTKEISAYVPHGDIDINSVSALVKDNIESTIYNKVASDVLQTIEPKFKPYVDENLRLKKLLEELSVELGNEKKRNKGLFDTVVKQNESIESLKSIIDDIKSELTILQKVNEDVAKKPEYKPVQKELHNKTELQEPLPEIKEEIKIIPLFSEDKTNYGKTIHNFITECEVLRSEIDTTLADDEHKDIYLKLVDKCIKKLISLGDKLEKNEYDSAKMASETAKIIKQTLAKALSQNSIKAMVENYFERCNIRKLPWYVGKKLSDEDYEYLEEQILYENVTDNNLNGAITAIEQDTYIVDYVEDDEMQEAVIAGIYHIGKMSK